MQQQHPAVRHRRLHRRQGAGLVAGEGRRLVGRGRGAAHGLEGAGRDGLGGEVDARPRPSAAGWPAWWPPGGRVRGREAPARGRQRLGDRPPAGSLGRLGAGPRPGHQPLGRSPRRGAERPGAVRAAAQRAVRPGGQHQAQARGPRGEVVARHPERELEEIRCHGRRVHHARQGREPALVRRPPGGPPPRPAPAGDRVGTRRAPRRPPHRPARREPHSPGPGRGRAPRPGGSPARRRGPPRFGQALAAKRPPASRPTSVFSQVKSGSVRPKWPYAAVFW